MDCTKYRYCDKEAIPPMSCSDGLFFCQEEQRCMKPGEANCITRLVERLYDIVEHKNRSKWHSCSENVHQLWAQVKEYTERYVPTAEELAESSEYSEEWLTEDVKKQLKKIEKWLKTIPSRVRRSRLVRRKKSHSKKALPDLFKRWVIVRSSLHL